MELSFHRRIVLVIYTHIPTSCPDLFQVILGTGVPVAAHSSCIVLPLITSCVDTSPELAMSGTTTQQYIGIGRVVYSCSPTYHN